MENYTETSTGRIQKVSIVPEQVRLNDFIVADDVWYSIVAIYKYMEPEDEDDYWFDFTGESETGEKIYIGVDKNEEDMWEYAVWEIVPKKEVRSDEKLSKIGSNGHSNKIEYNGIEYKISYEGDKLYEASVESFVKGRTKNPVKYPVLISDLEDNSGENFLCIEIDEDEVVELSIGKYITDVELVKNREEKPKFMDKIKNIFGGRRL
ncbi:DUF4178 domain-containing protein [Haliovirga abyssi]|uniref:DUF4178 domain-containing protein n=1 Tax=Haliovirga abyssi TaxID=2996794 RepID=A0AAU9DFX8_9FUSO|nr:hypothetical protein [Haliovirga abyssi]BDU51362.1 hypothetical protein HLVA_19310 [Haliovirga abyssi]